MTAGITEVSASDLGRAVRAARGVRCLEQKELAHVCGVTYGQISNIKRGECFPRRRTLRRICAALLVSEEAIMAAARGDMAWVLVERRAQ